MLRFAPADLAALVASGKGLPTAWRSTVQSSGLGVGT